MKKTILLLVIALTFAFVSCGDGNQSSASTEGLEYTLLDNGSYEVSGIGSATDVDIVIPREYNGKSVTSIGQNAFYGCHNITSVKISKGISSIGQGAFADCISIKSIILPDTLNFIGKGAFLGCSSLSYNEYNNAKYLGSAKNPYLALVAAKKTDITSCQINKNTKFICNRAFFLCSSLTSVKISSSVTDIGAGAFQGCASLSSVTLPSGINSIEDETFTGCTSLASIIIPSKVSSIGSNAFDGCSFLAEVNLSDGIDTIKSYAFSNCVSLTNIYLPDSVASIGSCAFYSCTSLASIDCEAEVAGEYWAVDWLENCEASVSYGVKQTITYN